ncbi:UNVERIFIED_CONTAM: hypothetical protein GTU68_015689 [Idotea baltica]|uniref:glutamate racemase n=1 Tax=Francisella sp. Scap27 TaxID=2589986 RepID=UPI0015BE1679|nr:glutamate racemase [Francisella sp. Scap27]MCL4117624.1 hypothetical protein [Idotea baltica]QLE78376.1 glutamate racemase [Francisella sp. Scap27]
MSDSRAIGVFDSGVGGLTVVKNIMEQLPNENIVYFGDIARIPYGTKSKETIQKFAAQTAKFLVQYDVKVIIIACNTISALAKDIVKNIAKDIPVIDVISVAVKSVQNFKYIGVLATPATVNSHAYEQNILLQNKNAKVYSQACGLFVSMIEEGFISGDIVRIIAKEYLMNFENQKLNCMILGCTHYPIIKETLADILIDIELIDPSYLATIELKKLLQENNISNSSINSAKYEFFVTDIPHKFKSIGEMFLDTKMNYLKIVDIDNFL